MVVMVVVLLLVVAMGGHVALELVVVHVVQVLVGTRRLALLLDLLAAEVAANVAVHIISVTRDLAAALVSAPRALKRLGCHGDVGTLTLKVANGPNACTARADDVCALCELRGLPRGVPSLGLADGLHVKGRF